MKVLKYLLLFAPIVLLAYYKYLYDVTLDVQWALRWKLWVLVTPAQYLVLACLMVRSKEDKVFTMWCESIIAFILINNVWDVFAEVANISFRMPSGVDNPGRWILFAGLMALAFGRTWYHKREVKVYGK